VLSPTEKMCVGLVTNTQHQFIRDMTVVIFLFLA